MNLQRFAPLDDIGAPIYVSRRPEDRPRKLNMAIAYCFETWRVPENTIPLKVTLEVP